MECHWKAWLPWDRSVEAMIFSPAAVSAAGSARGAAEEEEEEEEEASLPLAALSLAMGANSREEKETNRWPPLEHKSSGVQCPVPTLIVPMNINLLPKVCI